MTNTANTESTEPRYPLSAAEVIKQSGLPEVVAVKHLVRLIPFPGNPYIEEPFCADQFLNNEPSDPELRNAITEPLSGEGGLGRVACDLGCKGVIVGADGSVVQSHCPLLNSPEA